MLKSNSKKAKENIKNYIINNFDYSSYEDEQNPAPTEYKDICTCIYNTMQEEKRYNRSINDYMTFEDWCRGLPSILDTCYYYNRSAIEDLMQILEETVEEAYKYTERQAEERLTQLLFREINSNRNK